MQQHKTEFRDGMRIDWDMPNTMDDGVVLRCDVLRLVMNDRSKSQ